jgi:hypothetical protein
MTVIRKPKAKTPENFIEQGGSAPIETRAEIGEKIPGQPGRPKKEKLEPEIGLKLRLPESLLEQIDADVDLRQPKPSRHQWFLEAIYEKLDQS